MPLFSTPLTWVGAEPLTSGEAICPRVSFNVAAPALATGTILLSYWTAVTSGTATTVATATAGTAASGLTLAKTGIYSVAANGDITLLAATADLHASLWTSTFTTYASSLSQNFTRAAGQRYAMACLAVGTTPPALTGPGNSASYQLAPILGGTVPGQTDLPASVAHGSISANFQFVSAVVSP